MAKINEVMLPEIPLSNNNCSGKHRTSASPGLLYPMFFDILPPNSIGNYQTSFKIKSFAANTPVFGRFKVRVDTYVQDLRAYSYELARNGEIADLGSSNPSFSKLPIINVVDGEDAQVSTVSPNAMKRLSVAPTSLDCYLGLPANYVVNNIFYNNSVNDSVAFYQKSAIPWLMYADIYRNYYVNRQYDFYPMAGWYQTGVDEDGYAILSEGYNTKSVSDLDSFIESAFASQASSSSNVNISTLSTNPWKAKRYQTGASINKLWYPHSAYHGGLFLVNHEPDLNTAWLSNSNYASMTSLAKMNVTNSAITYDQIIGTSHIQRFLQNIYSTGGLIGDWLYAEYGQSAVSSVPKLIDSSVSFYDFDDVISQSDTTTADSSTTGQGAALGQRGGLGYGAGWSKQTEVVTRGGYKAVMVLFTIIPIVDYFQGVDYRLNITDLGRFPMPSFSNYSFESRLAEQVMAVPAVRDATGKIISRPRRADFTNTDNTIDLNVYPNATSSLGYQASYAPWRSEISRVTGELCDTQRDWVLLRDYNYIYGGSTSSDISNTNVLFSSYVYPENYNHIFTAGGLLDNFQVNAKVFNSHKVLPIAKVAFPKVL